MTPQEFENAEACLRRVLSEAGLAPEPIGRGTFHVDFGEPHLPISTAVAAIIPDAAQLLVYLNFGFLVPEESRAAALEAVARANWDLIIGNFELDVRDGHLRFKFSLDFEDAELTEPLIRNGLRGAMGAIEAHADAVMRAISP
jgi:hypothetical protein